MSNPNLITIDSILCKSLADDVYSDSAYSSPTTLLENPISSNYLIKISSLFVTNITTVSPYNINCRLLKANATFGILAHNISVPLYSSLNLVFKDTPIYLEEGDKLQMFTSIQDTLQYICNYEIIS